MGLRGRDRVSAPLGGVHWLALIGQPPEHREHRNTPGIPPEIDPQALIEAFATVDAGVFRPTTIGPRTWLMKHVHIGHDALIGMDCELAPGVVVGGEVEIGNHVRIGVNACIRPCIKVGNGARIGAGAVVVKDVPEGAVVVGNPAKPLGGNTRWHSDSEIWAEWFANRG